MQRISSAREASMFRGRFVAHVWPNEFRPPVHNGLHYGYVKEPVERWRGTPQLGHELAVVWRADEVRIRHTLTQDDVHRGLRIRLATQDEIEQIALRIWVGELGLGLSAREQKQLMARFHRGCQVQELLFPPLID